MRELWVYERQCLSFLREQESMDWWRGGHRVKYPDVLILARLDDTYLGVPELQVCGLKDLILDRLNSGSAGDILTVCKILVRTFTIICSSVSLIIAENSLRTLCF